MNIRLENVTSDISPTNYVSFLQAHQKPKGRTDRDSMHSVSSVRSVMSSMTTFWNSIGLGGSASSRTERAKAVAEADLKYLYSAFTKLPSLRLTSDHRARLIKGYEEFPFDTAVPLFAFKNLQQVDIVDLDFRQFCGWDRLAEQLTLLTIKRGKIDDPAEVLTDIVLDDMERYRRRTNKRRRQYSPTPTSSWTVPSTPRAEFAQSNSDPGSPSEAAEMPLKSRQNVPASPGRPLRPSHQPNTGRQRHNTHDASCLARSRHNIQPVTSVSRPRPGTKDGASTGRIRYAIDAGDPDMAASEEDGEVTCSGRTPPKVLEVGRETDITIAGSLSPKRPFNSRPGSSYRHVRAYSTYSTKYTRSGSGSSTSSDTYRRSESASNLLDFEDTLPSSKWQRLKYLSLADNSLTYISHHSLVPVATTLKSLNLAANLFTEVPDSLALLTRLVSLDLSSCMIESLQSLAKSPLPAITTLKLKSNRLQSLAGVERLLSLEQLNVQDNKLTDPTEAARLTGLPNIRKVWLKHNPFTKSYQNWRVTVFNLFRNTPGYVEDIMIDDNPPGFSERKHLVDRVPEREHHVVHPELTRAPEVPVIVQTPERPKLSVIDIQEVARTPSTRRRKTPRRRIVDLAAQEDTFARTYSDSVTITRHSIDSTRQERKSSGEDDDLMLHVQSVSSIEDITLPSPLDSVSGSHDEYRAKIEALRQQFGSNWLSQLGDQDWHNDHHLEMQRADGVAHPGMQRANTTAIASEGRTLG